MEVSYIAEDEKTEVYISDLDVIYVVYWQCGKFSHVPQMSCVITLEDNDG